MTLVRSIVGCCALMFGLCATTSRCRGAEGVALLQSGEQFTYTVGWGVLGHAGELKIDAKDELIAGQRHVRVDSSTASRGFVRLLYAFDGTASMVFDAANGRLLNASATTDAKDERTDASISFDYDKRLAHYVDKVKPSRSANIPLPDGMPMDMITALIQTRVWDMRPGDQRDVLVLFDKDFYPLRITAEHEETISTPNGPRRSLLLIPRMPEKPKGMFRRGGEVRVWVSADEDRLPLRFEVRLKVGTAYAVLTEYRAPTAPGP